MSPDWLIISQFLLEHPQVYLWITCSMDSCQSIKIFKEKFGTTKCIGFTRWPNDSSSTKAFLLISPAVAHHLAVVDQGSVHNIFGFLVAAWHRLHPRRLEHENPPGFGRWCVLWGAKSSSYKGTLKLRTLKWFEWQFTGSHRQHTQD